MLRQLFNTVKGKYKKSKEIATDSNLIWDVMLYSQHFTCHWKLLVLLSRIQSAVLIDRNDQTGQSGPPSKLVANIPVGSNWNGPFHLMYQPKFPKFWGEWKAPLQLTKLVTWSNRDEDWKKANSFFQRLLCFRRRPQILTYLKLSTRTWLCVLHTVLGQCAKKVSDDLRGKIYL